MRRRTRTARPGSSSSAPHRLELRHVVGRDRLSGSGHGVVMESAANRPPVVRIERRAAKRARLDLEARLFEQLAPPAPVMGMLTLVQIAGSPQTEPRLKSRDARQPSLTRSTTEPLHRRHRVRPRDEATTRAAHVALARLGSRFVTARSRKIQPSRIPIILKPRGEGGHGQAERARAGPGEDTGNPAATEDEAETGTPGTPAGGRRDARSRTRGSGQGAGAHAE